MILPTEILLPYTTITYERVLSYQWYRIKIIIHTQCQKSIENLADYLPDYFPDISSDKCEKQYHIYEHSLSNNEFQALYDKLINTSYLRINTHVDIWWREYQITLNGKPALLFTNEAGWKVIKIVCEGDILILTCGLTCDPEKHLLRVVREVLYRSLENYGGITLHAAAISIYSKGFIIIGPSGAGKTSLLGRLVDYYKCDFITNDRVILLNINDNIIIYHLPLSIRFGLGYALANPKLRAYLYSGTLSRKREYSAQDINLAQSNAEESWGARKKLELTPREFTRIFNVKNRYCVPLKGVLFPQLYKDKEIFHIEEITPEKAMEITQAELLTPYDQTWPEPWLVKRNGSVAELREKSQRFLYDILTKVNRRSLHFGVPFVDRNQQLYENIFA